MMKLIVTIILAFYGTGLYATSAVDLFDQDRGQEKSSEPVKKKAPKKRKLQPRGNVFSLTGISKIGDKYVIYLNSAKGKRNKFIWYEQQKPPMTKIYNDYEIDKIFDRSVYLNIISKKPCIENPLQGVSCDTKNKQMVLQLVRKKAVAARSSASGKAQRRKRQKYVMQEKKTPRTSPLKQNKLGK